MSRASAALIAALALTALNAAKPLVIDDPLYATFARQIVAHPGDPYGFDVYWYDAPEPAIGFGWVPPVLPYWLAGAMALFGDRPVAWKSWLLPFALAFSGSLAFLLGRFARPLAVPVVFALALAPVVLPGLNLMLDVPALALGVLGYALFVLAGERRDARLALLSGLALGLAMQTKYSAAVYPALVLAHAAIYRRPREAAVALLLAVGIFVGWEGFLFARYGESHFLTGLEHLRSHEFLPGVALAEDEMQGSAALYWSLSLLTLLGGTAALPALLALVGLGASRWIVTGAALVTGLAFAAIPVLPRPPVFEAANFFAVHAAYYPEIFLFLPLGLGAAGVLVAAALRLLRRGDEAGREPDRVLVLWLGLEIAGFFLFSPYVAARRVIGLVVAATLLAARAASRRASERDARVGVWVATAFGIALGALYFGADLADARTRRNLVERVARQLPQLGADREHETIWYSGHWELQYYAERAGMRPVIAGESELRPGDWLLLCSGTTMPPLAIPLDRLEMRDKLPATSAWPWSTIPRYYDGPVPLIRQPETQAIAWIFRVTHGLVPRLAVPVLEREAVQ